MQSVTSEAVIVDECFLVGMQHIWLYAHLAPRAAILMLGNRWQVQTIEPFTPWQSVDHPGSTDWCRGADWYAQVNSLQLRDSYRFGGEIWQLACSILEKAGVACEEPGEVGAAHASTSGALRRTACPRPRRPPAPQPPLLPLLEC